MPIRLLILTFCFVAHALAEPQNLTPLAGATSLSHINGAYLAFYKHQIRTSPDLKHWTTYEVPGESPIKLVAFGKGIYIVGSDSETHLSTDLRTFEALPDLKLTHVLFDGNRFVAIAPESILSSNDGRTWTSALVGQFTGLAHAGGRTVAIGAKIALSEGQAFTIVENSPEFLQHVAAIPGLFVANNTNGQVTVSTDGQNWSHLSALNIRGKLYAVGDTVYAINSGYLSTSVDGVDWRRGNYLGEFRNIFDDGKGTLAFGDELLRLDDLENPTFVAFGHSLSCGAAVSLADRLVVCRYSGVYASSNGLDWTKTHKFWSNLWASSDEALIMLSEDKAYVTHDGLTWKTVRLPFGPNFIRRTPMGFLTGVSDSNDTGACSFLQSQDGLTWEPAEVNCLAAHGVAKSDLMLAYTSSQVWRSANLLDWEPTGIIAGYYDGISVVGDAFLVRGSSGYQLSPDGVRFEHFSRPGDLVAVGGLWNHYLDAWSYSKDGRTWADSEISGRPLTVWKGKIVWQDTSLFVSEFPETPVQVVLIPWVVQNQTWQSRIVINNTNSTSINVELSAVTEDNAVLTQFLSLGPGEIFVRDPEALFPGTTRYSLFLKAHGTGVYPVFQVNALINGVFSPSQSGGILLNKLSKRLVFPFMNATDSNAIVLVETSAAQVPSTAMVRILDQEGVELASQYVRLSGWTPFAKLVVDLFPNLTLPDHFNLVVEGVQLAGTAFIFNREGQPSMANAFSLPN